MQYGWTWHESIIRALTLKLSEEFLLRTTSGAEAAKYKIFSDARGPQNASFLGWGASGFKFSGCPIVANARGFKWKEYMSASKQNENLILILAKKCVCLI